MPLPHQCFTKIHSKMGKNVKKSAFDPKAFADKIRSQHGSEMDVFVREERWREMLPADAAEYIESLRDSDVSASGDEYFRADFPGLGWIFLPRDTEVSEGDYLVCYKAGGGRRYDTLAIVSEGE